MSLQTIILLMDLSYVCYGAESDIALFMFGILASKQTKAFKLI